MRVSRVEPEGVQLCLFFFFLVGEQREDQKYHEKRAIIDQPVKHHLTCHHWPASETPFKWLFAGVPLIAQH